ncbi:hypothetical protein L1887_59805 [Cichorium endivia]|nr:hypothetical protein L1887_59805 [Cichorium endivia]
MCTDEDRRSVPQGMGVWAGAGRVPKQAKRTGRLASTALFGDESQRRRSGNGRKEEHLHEGRAQCLGEAENQVQERRPAAQARFRVARWRDGGLGGLRVLGLGRGDGDGGWGRRSWDEAAALRSGPGATGHRQLIASPSPALAPMRLQSPTSAQALACAPGICQASSDSFNAFQNAKGPVQSPCPTAQLLRHCRFHGMSTRSECTDGNLLSAVSLWPERCGPQVEGGSQQSLKKKKGHASSTVGIALRTGRAETRAGNVQLQSAAAAPV